MLKLGLRHSPRVPSNFSFWAQVCVPQSSYLRRWNFRRAAVLLGSENFHSLMRNVPLHHIYRLFSACKFLTFINQIIGVPPSRPPGSRAGGGVLSVLLWIGCCAHSVFTHGRQSERWELLKSRPVFPPQFLSLWRDPPGSHLYVKCASMIVRYEINVLEAWKIWSLIAYL